MKLTDLIKDLLNKGFSITGVSITDESLSYHLDGFYKSGDVKLYETNNQMFALARYDELTLLDDENPFNTLVGLNNRWWNSSKERWDGWNVPDKKWLPYLIEQGYVKETIETKKSYI